MSYKASILADSITEQGERLTTFEITYPRFVHSELLTHRLFSRNSASSRAIPVEKMLKRIEEDPVFPVWWGANQKGMQAKEELPPDEKHIARVLWEEGADEAVDRARRLSDIGLHKQIANRVTEPWMWITVIVTATEWENFFGLRCHPDAQPEIKKIAEMMRGLYIHNLLIYEEEKSGDFGEVVNGDNAPLRLVKEGDWHLPLWNPQSMDRDLIKSEWGEEMIEVSADEWLPQKILVSVGRCARVSYLTHAGERDPQADVDLALRLAQSKHWSPWEHVATPFTRQQRDVIKDLEDHITTHPSGFHVETLIVNEMFRNLRFSGNFRGWNQARKFFPNESGQNV